MTNAELQSILSRHHPSIPITVYCEGTIREVLDTDITFDLDNRAQLSLLVANKPDLQQRAHAIAESIYATTYDP